MKHILIIETDIPDPEFSVIARSKGVYTNSFDEWDEVDYSAVIPPTELYITAVSKHEYLYVEQRSSFIAGALWTLKKLGL